VWRGMLLLSFAVLTARAGSRRPSHQVWAAGAPRRTWRRGARTPACVCACAQEARCHCDSPAFLPAAAALRARATDSGARCAFRFAPRRWRTARLKTSRACAAVLSCCARRCCCVALRARLPVAHSRAARLTGHAMGNALRASSGVCVRHCRHRAVPAALKLLAGV
jgi:hypothetical protein